MPIRGYNTQVRHHGKSFRIQTEDSGRGHILTLLVTEDGRTIASTTTKYEQADDVKSLMRESHKAMFIALREGRLGQAGTKDEPS